MTVTVSVGLALVTLPLTVTLLPVAASLKLTVSSELTCTLPNTGVSGGVRLTMKLLE